MKPGKNNRKYKFIFPLVTAAAVTAGSFSAVTAAEVQGPVAPSTGSATTNQPEPAPNTNATASNQSEPAPGTTSANQASDGQGTLSPPSDNSKSSVFGQASSVEAPTDEKLSSLLTQLQDRLPVSNGSWSVYVRDLYNESEGSVNDHSMQAASLIKLYIMGAVYENFDALSASGNLGDLLTKMITVSDNDAANELVKLLGGGDTSKGMMVVNSFCTQYGYNNTSMGRLLLTDNTTADNYTSVKDCGKFLYHMYNNKFTHSSDMMELLLAQTRRGKIPAGIPDGVQVGNKTGELDDVQNDAAIVYAEKPYVVCIMAEGVSGTDGPVQAIASLSNVIYGYTNET